MKSLLIAALLLGVSGCAQWHSLVGNDDSEQAALQQSARVVSAPSRRMLVRERDDAELVVVTAIDTVSTHSYWRGLFGATPYATEVVLTPGPHTLLVQYQDAIFYGDGELAFDAEMGKIYRLQKKVQGLSVQIWLEDAQGQRLATSGQNLALARRSR